MSTRPIVLCRLPGCQYARTPDPGMPIAIIGTVQPSLPSRARTCHRRGGIKPGSLADDWQRGRGCQGALSRAVWSCSHRRSSFRHATPVPPRRHEPAKDPQNACSRAVAPAQTGCASRYSGRRYRALPERPGSLPRRCPRRPSPGRTVPSPTRSRASARRSRRCRRPPAPCRRAPNRAKARAG